MRWATAEAVKLEGAWAAAWNTLAVGSRAYRRRTGATGTVTVDSTKSKIASGQARSLQVVLVQDAASVSVAIPTAPRQELADPCRERPGVLGALRKISEPHPFEMSGAAVCSALAMAMRGSAFLPCSEFIGG